MYNKKVNNMTKEKIEEGTSVATKERIKISHPKSYKVILLNDDYTPMDFVVSILESIFQKSPSESVRIMLEVHQKGAGVCGIYTKQIAETKVELVLSRAKEASYPLKSIMEEV